MIQSPSTHLTREQPRRQRLPLPDYDYAQAGAYSVTICTRGQTCLLGGGNDGEIQPNNAGETVTRCWEEVPQHFPYVELDGFVVMPNHVHGVLLFGERELAGEPARAGHARPLHVVVGAFRSAVSRRQGAVWQRSYWERIVRTAEELDHIRAYIEDNPLRWPANPAFSHP